MAEHNPSDAEFLDSEKLRILVPPGQKRQRIDFYLAHQIENATRNKVQRGIEDQLVKVNGKIVKRSYQIQPHDVIDITLPRPRRLEAQAENIPLDIVFEDESIIVVDKPAGMVTHPAYSNYSGTLVNALLYHSQLLSSNAELRPGIVHRLDKETSGILVVAKTDAAHAFIAKQFAKHTTEREYWAIVWGRLKKDDGIIAAPLGRSKKDRKKIAVASDGKQAVTEYHLIEEFGYLSLIRLRLKTGRTHQIRVHLSHIGHPVFGDPTYGGRSNTWGGLSGKKSQQAANLLKILARQALHAKSLGFIHPRTKQFVRFDSDLPDDMKEVLRMCRAGE
jgi:23S rRNA pseudouridine1911/1915/1917 synthase